MNNSAMRYVRPTMLPVEPAKYVEDFSNNLCQQQTLDQMPKVG